MENEDEIKKITNDVSIKELTALALSIFNLIQLRVSAKSGELDSADIKALSQVVGLVENLKSSFPLDRIGTEEVDKPNTIQFIDATSLSTVAKLIQRLDDIPITMTFGEGKNNPTLPEYLPNVKPFGKLPTATKNPLQAVELSLEVPMDTKTIVAAAEQATHDAYLEARKHKLSMILQEEGNLIEIDENGVKKILYKIEKPNVPLPLKFKLK